MTPPEFKPGDRVRVTGLHTAPLLGREGSVTEADAWNVTVRLDGERKRYLFGASALTHLPREEAKDEV